MKKFYKRLSYSLGNEDWQPELEALQLRPTDRVVCITASGDRPLHLLLDNCKEILAVDANPIQNHLLELKCQAMNRLNVKEYQQFLGVDECHNRLQTLQTLLPHLDKQAQAYWRTNSTKIQKGVVYQGSIERWVYILSLFLRIARKNEIRKLFAMTNIEEQRDFLKNEWNHKLWRNVLKFTLNTKVSRFFFKDPGLYAYVDRSIQPGEYIYDRIMGVLDRSLARENMLISLIFKGSVGKEALPPHLSETNFQLIKSRLGKIKIHTSDIISHLESMPENSVDKFSLSDVISYVEHSDFLRLLKAMYRTARPGARFCMRQLMTDYKIPKGLEPYFSREPILEKKLDKDDLSFVYRFMTGSINKE